MKPENFAAEDHFYPHILNGQLHPMIRSFLDIDTKKIAACYCHFFCFVFVFFIQVRSNSNNYVTKKNYSNKNQISHCSGADLFVVTNNKGGRYLCVVETSTCPRGQKSMSLPELEMEIMAFGNSVGRV